MTKLLRREKPIFMASSVFDLGKPTKGIDLPLTGVSSFSTEGKKVSHDYFKLAATNTKDTDKFYISISGCYEAQNCISDKISKAASTVEFYPLNNGNVLYLFISERVIINRENREIKYIVKEGKKLWEIGT